ncbi:hypothetical protein DNTS_018773, partial [Danionella cerebrum]
PLVAYHVTQKTVVGVTSFTARARARHAMAQSSAKEENDHQTKESMAGSEKKTGTERYSEDYGYRLFPERKEYKYKSLIAESLFTFRHKCQLMLTFAMERMDKNRHFSCEDCDSIVSGGFDATTSQIVLCQNNIHQQSHMNRVVIHELIHAFDHCRARVDWFNNLRHLACSEIRAANLSGDCSFINEMFRVNSGFKKHHQECVRWRARRSMDAVRNVSQKELDLVIDEVFDSCFKDHAPFDRIPHSKKDAKFAYRDFQNRDRYYANL